MANVGGTGRSRPCSRARVSLCSVAGPTSKSRTGCAFRTTSLGNHILSVQRPLCMSLRPQKAEFILKAGSFNMGTNYLIGGAVSIVNPVFCLVSLISVKSVSAWIRRNIGQSAHYGLVILIVSWSQYGYNATFDLAWRLLFLVLL